MSDSDVPKKRLEPTVYYAAERTLLAWVRTGLAMMSFGFVVARFGLFLQELAAASTSHHFRSTGFSLWIGTSLIFLGVLLTVWATFNNWFTVRKLERGEGFPFRALSLGNVVAMLLAMLGLVMAFYLIFGIESRT